MVSSELLVDPDTGEVFTPDGETATEYATRLQDTNCVRVRIFCPKKFPGMSVGNFRTKLRRNFVKYLLRY
jgi:hypothetical protein